VTVLAAVGFFAGGDAWREFFDLPSLLVTVGGTLAVTYLTFSWVRLPRRGGSRLWDFFDRPKSITATEECRRRSLPSRLLLDRF